MIMTMRIIVNVEKEEMLGAVSMMNLLGNMNDELTEEVRKAVNGFTDEELTITDKRFRLSVIMSALSEICRISDETDKKQ